MASIRRMRVNHLGLPVADQTRSLQFYAEYFGFEPVTARRFEDGTVIVQDGDGFDLALHTVAEPAPDPEFLHFGFRIGTPEEVRALRERMTGDGLRVETYWEP